MISKEKIKEMMDCLDRADIPQTDRIARYYDSEEEMIKEVKLALNPDGDWNIV